MIPEDFRRLKPGAHLIALDAYGRLLPVVLAEVPADWRDRSRSAVVTTLGDFTKAWITPNDWREPIPWPIWDLFNNLEDAESAQALRLQGLERAP